jgi:CBS domain-containing protein
MSYYVKDYMDKEFPTLEVEASVVDAAKKLVNENKGYVIVLEKGKPYGIVTELDLVTKILAAEKDPKMVALKQITSTPLITIDPDEDLLKASEMMQARGVKRVAVVKDDIIYGVITSTNIAQKCGDYVNNSVLNPMLRSSASNRGASLNLIPFMPADSAAATQFTLSSMNTQSLASKPSRLSVSM